ncbi:conserved hypothetical protein [Renibacterium salmoninarum ATCC 33209]|uniref:Uncharacterized protein n=1 Tax=Renibacterium salmoninarum (strain ATCC 33209 / DSM 20767 / JCM 11484 / NBRC 15589 / NCIMB 2235) TaxID=288705 RepID=A9WQV2_RENSM|nr:hypothetical protein [Renibacterium salmoninarum]ABY23625.1 conserved hypothetical protein [Renibacterium salmoninarum ATCC 33209]
MNQMMHDLPPDGFGDAKDLLTKPGNYILDKMNGAMDANHTTGHDDKLKGTVSIGASGQLNDDVKASVKLDMAYEQNMSNGESTASAALKADAKLDLGDGLKLSENGELGMKVSMDKDHNITMLTLNAKGAFQGSMGVTGSHGPMPEGQKADFGTTISGGGQGSVQMDIRNTPENQSLITSYLSHAATGDNSGMASDLQKIYVASKVTLQADSVSKSESNLVDLDAGIGSLKIGGTSEYTTNVATGFKAANDTQIQLVRPNA